jgi:hypothetical protein
VDEDGLAGVDVATRSPPGSSPRGTTRRWRTCPGSRAEAALREARATNPFAPAYLLGRKELPRRVPAYVGFGDENEAVADVAEAAEGWLATPQAVAWLATVLAHDVSPPAPATPRRPRRKSSPPPIFAPPRLTRLWPFQAA